jgi:hypothetical protein
VVVQHLKCFHNRQNLLVLLDNCISFHFLFFFFFIQSTKNKNSREKQNKEFYSQKLVSDAVAAVVAAGRIAPGDGEFFLAGAGCGV